MSAIEISLNLSQRLTLTPQLRQSIELLTMGQQDLQELITNKVNENPFLEIASPNNIKDSNSTFSINDNYSKVINIQSNNDYEDDSAEHIFNLTDNNSNDFKADLYEQIQIKSYHINNRILALVEYLIGNLEDNGHLTDELDDLLLGLPEEANITIEELQQALIILQSLDPIGIASKNSTECLLMQINKDINNSKNDINHNLFTIAKIIVVEHFPLLAQKKYSKMALLLNISMVILKKAINYILTLNTHPITNNSFNNIEQGNNNLYHILPDIIIKQNVDNKGNKGLSVVINQDILPKVSINNSYAENINAINNDNSQYIKQKIQEGNWLIKSINQRFETLLKVAQLMVQEQEAFFYYGINAMQPLIMQSIADILNINVSTVSRALKNKYFQYESRKNILPLNYLLSSAVPTKLGGKISSKSITRMLEEFILKENKSLPLSDEQLVLLFKKEGVLISRRTINKYRSKLKILPTFMRKFTSN